MEIISWDFLFKIVVPSITTIFGAYQIKKRYDLETMLKMKSWNFHKHVALFLGDVQRTKDNILQNKVNDALVSIGNSEGQSQSLLKDTALLICHYEKPKYSKIDYWISLGKIEKDFKSMFLPFASDENILSKIKNIIFTKRKKNT